MLIPRSAPSAIAVATVCIAEILGLAGYSTVQALLPQLIDVWSMSNSQAGWLTGMPFAGYMLGVIPLVSLTDRVPARIIFLASSAVGAVSLLGVAFSADLMPALGWRALGGVALAGTYMPGLRALTDNVEGNRRARIAALYTSSFTFGTSLSFLLGRTGIVWGWRSAFILAGVLGIIGVLLAWAALPRTECAPAKQTARPFDLRTVFGNRDAVVLMLGYAVTIWGSSGLRQWIVVFLAFCARGDTSAEWSMLAIGALVGALGVPAGLLGNELSLRYGLRRVAAFVFLLSALANVLFGLTAMLPYGVVVTLSLLAGLMVQGNFSNLTSGILAVASPSQMGATVALYSCIGFAGGFIGTVLFGATLDGWGGAASQSAWMVAFGSCGLACFGGSIVTSLLLRSTRLRAAPARSR